MSSCPSTVGLRGVGLQAESPKVAFLFLFCLRILWSCTAALETEGEHAGLGATTGGLGARDATAEAITVSNWARVTPPSVGSSFPS